MRISRNKVATFDYTVRDQTGTIIDTSLEYGPLSYIHGKGVLIPGLEGALEGKSPGDTFSVTFPPSQGYGERDDSLVHVFPKRELNKLGDLRVGMQFQAEDKSGKRILVVSKIEGDKVTLDENHPLAGKTVSFDISIIAVRDATPEELRQGQAYDIVCRHDC